MIQNWREAEYGAADCMRRLGFSDVFVTQGSRDYGLDVMATDAVAQVKHTTRPVSRPDLQRLVGASLTTNTRLFFSRAGYTAEAIRYADEVDMALFAYNEDHRYKPQNEPAEWLVNIMPAFAPPPHASPRRISEPRSRLVDTRSSRVAPSWSFDGQLAIARVLLATLMISTSAVVAYVENESVKMYTFIAFVVLSAPLLIWHEHLK